MGSLADFYTACAVLPPTQRRWCAGAAFRVADAVRLGETYPAATARMLTVPQYANALSAAGLTADFQALAPTGATTAVALAGADYVSAPSSAGLQSAVDLRVKAQLANWASGSVQKLLGKWNTGTGGYLLEIDASGTVTFAANTSGTQVFTTSSPLGLAGNAIKWVRATWNAAAGQAIVYTSDDGATWTTVQTFAGSVGAIATNAELVTVGADAGGAQPMTGRIYRARLLSSINGATVGDFDPGSVTRTGVRTPGTYTDGQGNVWTVNGTGWDWV